MRQGDAISPVDKELWEYFATLYRNSNKGIKGRGKDRRIFTISKDNAGSQHGPQSVSSSNGGESEMFDYGKKDETSSNSSMEYHERENGYMTSQEIC